MPGRHDHRQHRGLLLDFGGVLTSSLLDAIRRFCVECGLGPDTLLDLFRDDPGGRRLLADVECGVISQSEFERGVGKLLGVGLAERFDAVVISEHTGTRKPDPAIYSLAAERLGVSCQACVFVDDLPMNLEPARALGMTVIHKTSAGQVISDLERVLQIPLR